MTHRKFILSTCAAVLALGMHAPPGLAQQPPRDATDTLWLCWYNHDSTFRCRLSRAPRLPASLRAPRPAPPAARNTLYPRRGPLPPIVKTIHEQPARLKSHTITIPLFTPPLDLQFAAALVQSVMCDVHPGCRALILRSTTAVIEAFEEDPARDEVESGTAR